MNECTEVAETLGSKAPAFRTYSQAVLYVHSQMPDESVTVISNVAWDLWMAQQS